MALSRQRLIVWVGGVTAALALVALGAYFTVDGLDKASKLAEVIGVFAALVGGGVSGFGLAQTRRSDTSPPRPEPVQPESPIPQNKTPTNIARDNATLFASLEGNIIYHSDRTASSASAHGRSELPDDPSRTGRIGDDAMTNSGDRLADSHKQKVPVETGFSHGVTDADLYVSQEPITHQSIRVESGFGYGVISTDLHVFADRGPIYLLENYRTERIPNAARLIAQPSRALKADYAVVDFPGRDEELAALSRWRDSSAARLAALWLHGPGGQGKSRLAREFIEQSARNGWKAVTATHCAGSLLPPPGTQGPAHRKRSRGTTCGRLRRPLVTQPSGLAV